MPMDASHEVLQRWFNCLERILHEEAELSGLLGHGTMTGNAREFLVNRVLKTVLPPSVHIGTGVIIGQRGTRSKQIDIVLYDANFPVLETQEGHGLYLVEGVIAAIEVKSTITKDGLFKSLDNCRSVGELMVAVKSPEERIPPNAWFLTKDDVAYFPPPCTYVFAFKSNTSNHATMGSYIDEWWQTRDMKSSEVDMLPQVVVAGNLTAQRGGRWTTFNVTGDLAESIERSNGTDARALMVVWDLAEPFGRFLCNLMLTVAGRVSREHMSVLFRYLPTEQYSVTCGDSEGTVVSCPADEEN